MKLWIELTDDEAELVSKIDFELATSRSRSHKEDLAILDAAGELTESLLERGAVPDIRRCYFVYPELNIGGHGKSRKEVFEQNGTIGRDIFRHGNFLDYLKYWVYGPSLPDETIDSFAELARDSFVDPEDLDKLAREHTRRHRLDPRSHHEEFYKLALECGLDESSARRVRHAVQSTKVRR